MNILDLIQSQLPPQAINQISSTIGESPDATKSAIGTALPAILGSLVSKVNASPDSATQVFNLLKRGQAGADSASNTFGGAGAGQQLTGSGSLLDSLLGSKLGGVSDFIADHSGIKGSSALSILGMAAPFLIRTLGKHAASEGLNAAGVGQLLNSQAGHLKEALPPALANMLGIGSLLSRTSETTIVPTQSVSSQSGNQRDTYNGSAARTTPRRGSPLKWAVPLVVLVALGIWVAADRSNRTPAMGGTADYTQTQTGHGVNAPNFSSLKLTPASLADKMAEAISSEDLNQKINLDGLSFDSAGHPEEAANRDLQEVGSVLNAAPSVKVVIIGYGNTQTEGVNQANGIKSVLVSAGIATDRILTHGEAGNSVPSMRLMQ